MGLELITAPATEPVTLAEAKAHLRVDAADEDALITRLIAAAREQAERLTGRAFIAQSWILRRDSWPENPARALEIPKPPLIEIASVSVYDRSGAQIILSNDLYIVDDASAPGRVVLKRTCVLPADPREADAVAIAFDAGYGEDASDVPAAIRTAVLHLTAHLYESRGDKNAVPPAQALALLAPFRVMGL